MKRDWAPSDLCSYTLKCAPENNDKVIYHMRVSLMVYINLSNQNTIPHQKTNDVFELLFCCTLQHRYAAHVERSLPAIDRSKLQAEKHAQN
jgi:hypothetical protein